MSRAKKRLIISVVALLVALAVATGTTYAWFTVNKEVNIDQMDVSVTAGSQGIYISNRKEGPYKTALTKAELEAAGYRSDASLTAVTSADGIAMKDMSGATISSETKQFIEFKLYFRASGEEAPIIDLVRKEGVDSPAGKITKFEPSVTAGLTITNEWKDLTANEYGNQNAFKQNELLPARAAHAARVSFESKEHNGAASTARIWDPYYADSNTFCGLPNPSNESKYDNIVKNFAIDYYNATFAAVNADIDAIPALTVGKIASTENKADFTKNVLKFAKNGATGFWEGDLVVRIWLEGYDGDCINSILGDGIIADFNFVIREA